MASGSPAVLAQAAAKVSGASITKVESRSNSTGGVAKGVNSPQGRYLPKFFDTLQGSERSIRVEWEAPAGGLGANGKLSLDYLEAGTGRKVRQVHSISASASGPQVTTFSIQRVGSGQLKPVDSWRVRLIVDGRVIAEKQSTSWK